MATALRPLVEQCTMVVIDAKQSCSAHSGEQRKTARKA